MLILIVLVIVMFVVQVTVQPVMLFAQIHLLHVTVQAVVPALIVSHVLIPTESAEHQPAAVILAVMIPPRIIIPKLLAVTVPVRPARAVLVVMLMLALIREINVLQIMAGVVRQTNAREQ